MRHAKSDWSNYELSDFDRPLNKRGIKAAANMGTFLNQQDFSILGKQKHPQIILSSPAKRAKKGKLMDVFSPRNISL